MTSDYRLKMDLANLIKGPKGMHTRGSCIEHSHITGSEALSLEVCCGRMLRASKATQIAMKPWQTGLTLPSLAVALRYEPGIESLCD
jgi:hypothetical protein